MELLNICEKIFQTIDLKTSLSEFCAETREKIIFEAVDKYFHRYIYPHEYESLFPCEYMLDNYGLFVDNKKISNYDDDEKVTINMACFIDNLLSLISNMDLNFVHIISNHIYLDENKYMCTNTNMLDKSVVHFLKATPYVGILHHVVSYLRKDYSLWSNRDNQLEYNYIDMEFFNIQNFVEENDMDDSFLAERTIDVLNNVSIHKQVATDYGLNDEEPIVYDILRGRYTCRFIPDYAKAAKQIVATINNVEPKPKNRRIFNKLAKDVILEMGMKYNIKRERMFARGKIQQTPVEQSKKDLYGLKLYLMRKRNEKFGIV